MPAKNNFIDFPLFQVPEYQTPRDYCRGENQQQALIILSSEEDNEDLNTFLAKILSAVKLDLQKDILLLAIPPGEQIHLGALIRQENIRTVITFGIPPKRMGVHLSPTPYHPMAIGSLKLLFAHSLGEIYTERQQGGKQKAGALWRSLQKLFV